MASSDRSGAHCTCPTWYLVPTNTYGFGGGGIRHEDIEQLNTEEGNNSNSLNTLEGNDSNSAPGVSSDKPIVWVLGGPGSGKGTQCEKIIEKYGFTHLSTGDMLRAEVKGGSARSKFIFNIMQQGGLVPNEVALDLLKEAIAAKAAETRGFLVDGYPRIRSQGIAFEENVATPAAILFFEASHSTLYQRLQQRAMELGRFDDNETTIRLRLKTHHETAHELLDEYDQKIKRINAEFPVDTVYAEVEKVIQALLSS